MLAATLSGASFILDGDTGGKGAFLMGGSDRSSSSEIIISYTELTEPLLSEIVCQSHNFVQEFAYLFLEAPNPTDRNLNQCK